VTVEETEDLSHESRSLAPDPPGSARLGEVGAGKSSGNEVHRWQLVDVAHVTYKRDVREVVLQHCLCRLPPLTKQLGLHAGALESELNSTDASKQPGDAPTLTT
jgi:hypothetical protein